MTPGGFIISVNLLASLRGSDYIIIHANARINSRDYTSVEFGM